MPDPFYPRFPVSPMSRIQTPVDGWVLSSCTSEESPESSPTEARGHMWCRKSWLSP